MNYVIITSTFFEDSNTNIYVQTDILILVKGEIKDATFFF